MGVHRSQQLSGTLPLRFRPMKTEGKKNRKTENRNQSRTIEDQEQDLRVTANLTARNKEQQQQGYIVLPVSEVRIRAIEGKGALLRVVE